MKGSVAAVHAGRRAGGVQNTHEFEVIRAVMLDDSPYMCYMNGAAGEFKTKHPAPPPTHSQQRRQIGPRTPPGRGEGGRRRGRDKREAEGGCRTKAWACTN